MKTVQNKNYGLEIYRFILCFWVLLYHCLKKTDSKLLLNFITKMYHVPSFFFISFFFLFPTISGRNIQKMKIRLYRLLIPYILWPIITWSFNNISFQIFKKSRFSCFLPFSLLKEQLIVGRPIFAQLWFHFNLILLTILFFILSLFLKINNFFKIVEFIAILFK